MTNHPEIDGKPTAVIDLGTDKIYVDRYLISNLKAMIEDVHKDDDVLVIIDGKEGAGKSNLAQTIGAYFAKGQLKEENICMTPPQFRDAVINAKKFEPIIFDEGYLGLASENSMQSYNKLLKKMLVTVRQKNLYLIIVVPSVFDINKYVVLHRADCLLHIFKHHGQRGHFAFYNENKLKNLYILGKKMYSYYNPPPNFAGRFVKFYGIDEDLYRKKKLDSLNKFLKESDDIDVGQRKQLLYAAISGYYQLLTEKHPKINLPTVASMLNCSERTINRAISWAKPRKMTVPVDKDTNKTRMIELALETGDLPIKEEETGDLPIKEEETGDLPIKEEDNDKDDPLMDMGLN